MSLSFIVIGERRDDPMILLMQGDDGRHYAFDLTSDAISPLEPDAEEHFDLLASPDDLLDWESLTDNV